MKKFLSNFNDIDLIFGICLFIFGGMSLYLDFNSGYHLCDTIEHLRASLAVSEGMLPYVDFFEHHHPLLWYIFAPLVKWFYLDANIIPILRVISTLGYWAVIFLTYKICEDLNGKRAAKFSTLFLISIPFLWFDVPNLRPDIFMLLFFLIGQRTFFKYLDKKQPLLLVYSYLSMVISFLFLQKVAIVLAIFGLFNLYCLVKKHIKLRDFICASCIASLPILMIMGFLLYKGILSDFIYYNYTFNTYMREYYGGYGDNIGYSLGIISVLLFLVIIRKYSFSFNTCILFLYFIAQGLLLFYFSSHGQYYIMYFIFAAMICGKWLAEYKNSVIALLVTFIISFIILFPSSEEKFSYRKFLAIADQIIQDNKTEDMLNLAITQVNIFAPIKNFYWFGFQNTAIIDQLYNDYKYFDLFDFIKQKKPKYLVLPPKSEIVQWHRSWFGYHNRLLLKKMQKYPELKSKLILISPDFWQIDEDWIEQNYTKDSSTGIYYRKDVEK